MTVTQKKLVDTRAIQFQIVEDENGGGRVRVRGEFARAGQATENKRVYPKKIWEKEIGRLEAAMKHRQVLGEMDHPVDGRTSLNRVSHIVTDMRLEDGILVGEAEVLPTDKGRNLMALLKSNVRIGVSSRGYGSTKANDKGEEVVQEDYRLVTFDFVADPADQNAYPEVFFEGCEFPPLGKEQEEKKAEEWAKRILAAAEAEKNGKAEEKPPTENEILAAIAAMKGEVRSEVRSELLSDPTVGAARTTIDSIMNLLRPFVLPEDAEAVVKSKEAEIARLKKECAEKDLQIADLTTENSKLADAAKEAGFKLYVERQIGTDPDAGFIKKLVGDVKQFESAEALKNKLAEVRADISKKREEEAQVEETKTREVERNRQLVRDVSEQYEEKIEVLEEAIEKLSIAQKATSLQLYAEKKLQKHPRAAKIRSLIESAQPDTRAAVDEIFENFAPVAPKDDDEAAAVRSRVRKLTRGGHESDVTEEETPRRSRVQEDYNGLGMDLGELKKLSGINKL